MVDERTVTVKVTPEEAEEIEERRRKKSWDGGYKRGLADALAASHGYIEDQKNREQFAATIRDLSLRP